MSHRITSIVLVVLFGLPVAALAQPAIHLEEARFSFGELPEGPEARHEFVVANTGKGDLKIDRIQTSCGCTSSTIGKKELKPGEKTVLTAIYDTNNRPGPFTKEIRIFSNDPAHPETVAVIEGMVKGKPVPSIGIEPTTVNVGKIRKGEKTTLKVVISNIGEKELVLESIISSDGLIQLWTKATSIAPGEKLEIKLPFSHKTAGSFRDIFHVKSNDPRRPFVGMVVTGEAE